MVKRIGILLAVGILAVWGAWAQTPKPDLAVTSLTVDGACHLVVTVRNVGSAPVPDWAYDHVGGIQFKYSQGAQSLGGAFFWYHDQQKAVAPPGGEVTFTLLGSEVSGTGEYTFWIDNKDVLPESTETNNTRTAMLSCTPSLPDLQIVEVGFTDDCRVRLVLANRGDAPLGDNYYTGSQTLFFQRTIDGHPGGQLYLNTLDPNKQLRPAGATFTFVEAATVTVAETITYETHFQGTQKTADGKSLSASLPERCAAEAQARPPSKTLRVPPVGTAPIKPLPQPKKQPTTKAGG